MNKERLLKLADFLDTLDPVRFDLYYWRDGGGHETNEINDDQLLNECNTTACAVGWACTIPSFKRAGLRFNATLGHPEYDGEIEFNAIRHFFQINGHQAFDLFADTSCATRRSTLPKTPPKSVANRIRHLVEQAQ